MTSDAPMKTADLYSVLSISRSATTDEIRKAYRRKALLLHPDKHSSANDADREKATRNFQEVSFAYAILSDEKRKGRYDRTGSVEDFGFDEGDGEALAKYFEELYKGMVTKEKIDQLQEKYVGSVEERSEVLKSYVKCSGDMTLILNDVPFSKCESEPRFLEIIDMAISTGQVPSFSKHTTSNTKEAQQNRRKKEEKEAKAAEKVAKEMAKSNETHGNGETTELQQLLQQRGQKRLQNLVESLEAKYGKKTKTSSKKGNGGARRTKDGGTKDETSTNGESTEKSEEQVDGWEDDSTMPSEPTEEEFRAIQERLFNKSTTENDAPVKKKGKKSGMVLKGTTTRGTRASTRNKK